jgi:hypothetical protein
MLVLSEFFLAALQDFEAIGSSIIERKVLMTYLAARPLLENEDSQLEVSGPRIPIPGQSKARFSLGLRVRYRCLNPGAFSGEGHALTIASDGAVVAARHILSVGARLELRIEWPLLLEGGVPLQLVTVGTVVQCSLYSFSVLFREYQFRTATCNAKPFADVHAGADERMRR